MSQVWVITGHRTETWNNTSKELKSVFEHGHLTDIRVLACHGYTWLSDNPRVEGYQYMFVYLMPVAEYINKRAGGEHITGAAGGFAYTSSDDSHRPWVKEWKWGAETPNQYEVGLFYSDDRRGTCRPYFYYGENPVPVSSFWVDGQVVFGDNLKVDLTDLAKGIVAWPSAHSYALAQAPIKSIDVINTEYPGLQDVVPALTTEVFMYKTLCNYTNIQQMQEFGFSNSRTETGKWTFGGGVKLSASAEGKVGVPLVTEGKVKAGIELTFNMAHETLTGNTFTYSEKAPVAVPAMSAVKCSAAFKMGSVTVSGIWTVRITYEAGLTVVVKLPTVVTTANAYSGEVSYKQVPLPPLTEGLLPTGASA